MRPTTFTAHVYYPFLPFLIIFVRSQQFCYLHRSSPCLHVFQSHRKPRLSRSVSPPRDSVSKCQGQVIRRDHIIYIQEGIRRDTNENETLIRKILTRVFGLINDHQRRCYFASRATVVCNCSLDIIGQS